jgi:hypothetical protein
MRSELRFVSNACVYVVDQSSQEKTEASLQDLSLHGLSIKADGFIDIEPNSSYIIAVIPEKETNIEKFKMEIQSRWVKMNKSKMESGFSILVPFDEKGFKDYLDYLAIKSKTDTPPEKARPEELYSEKEDSSGPS